MAATVEQAAIESATANYESRTRLGGHPRLAGRAVWLALTLLSLSVIVAAIIVRLRSLDRFSAASLPATWTMDAFRAALASLGLSINFYLAFNLFFAYLLIAGFLTTAFVIFLRRSDDWVVLYVSLLFILWPLSILDFSNLLDMIPAFRLPVNFLAVLGTLSLLPFFFIFPNGRVVPHAAPWIIALWAILVLSSSFSPGSILDATTWPALLNFLMQAGFIGAGVVAQIYRYTCVSNAAERQQTKWVVFCGTLMALVLVAYVMIRVIFPAVNQPGVPGLAYVLALPVVSFFFLLLPIGIGLSVLRYRLWDIDLLISRALVYIPLTALLAGLFAASVTFLQKGFIAVTGKGSDFSAVLGTLLVVAALTPVKDRLQALVDKRFKEGVEPTRRLTAFGEQVRSR
ncbi:MAG TPA: hypothetical protein VLL57_02310, partial [Candidatus Binataceae bacterium]|nr:hypothetical protein [Candidatus Binataceae bacterium]